VSYWNFSVPQQTVFLQFLPSHHGRKNFKKFKVKEAQAASDPPSICSKRNINATKAARCIPRGSARDQKDRVVKHLEMSSC
jgi:hypothetical protein